MDESDCVVLAVLCGGESGVRRAKVHGVFELSFCIESGENGGVFERQDFVTSPGRG